MHQLIFENEGDKKKSQRYHIFLGHPFEIKNEEYEENIFQIKNDISVNELIYVYNFLCIFNYALGVLITRVVSFLCDFNFV